MSRGGSTQRESERTLLDVFRAHVEVAPDGVALRHFAEDGALATVTWRQWSERSRALAAGLLAAGLQPGGRVALLSRARVECALIEIAVLMAGGILVPIYPNELPASCARFIEDSGARFAIAEDPWQLKKLLDSAVADGADLQLVLIDPEMRLQSGDVASTAELGVSAAHVTTLARLAARGAQARSARADDELAARSESVLSDGCAAICYTPGTEGSPKGVMLTHHNLVATCDALARALPMRPDDVSLAYLPVAQAFSHTAFWLAVRAGAAIAYARGEGAVLEDLATLAPTVLFGVPRLFERIEEGLEAELIGTGGLQSVVAAWGFGRRGERGDGAGLLARARGALSKRLIQRRLAQKLGGRLRFAVSGGAPLGVDTARFFEEHGVPLLEGYGMVETAAATHVNRLDDRVVGTVGLPLPGVEARVLDDGELVVRGANVTPGYWGNPLESRKVFDDGGWFRTGDLGRIDASGRLTITDRKRDIIVTANGKAIAPGPIAEKLRADPLVGQAFIYGDRRTYLTALIELDRATLARFAEEHGVAGEYEALTRHPRVYGHVEALVERVNAGLPPHENIKKFAILSGELTTESGDLTPVLGLRRRAIAERHKALLDSFYSESF
ncbi:MAG: long-chain fatty acid--CoA ligase [Myxococcales bacterium]|nr:long-chain fatty acid--CoA ligase [Myxococcales bacterium]MCB9733866.1 long-chain fatty acid--CoA ligase [Deltaproteobacteria bacterium]